KKRQWAKEDATPEGAEARDAIDNANAETDRYKKAVKEVQKLEKKLKKEPDNEELQDAVTQGQRVAQELQDRAEEAAQRAEEALGKKEGVAALRKEIKAATAGLAYRFKSIDDGYIVNSIVSGHKTKEEVLDSLDNLTFAALSVNAPKFKKYNLVLGNGNAFNP